MKLSLSLFEKWFTVFAFFFSTTPIIPIFRIVIEGTAIYESDPFSQIIWFSIYLALLFFIILRWQRIVYVAKKDKLLIFVTGLALFSALWSVDPIITLQS
jgi:hypothetical protein